MGGDTPVEQRTAGEKAGPLGAVQQLGRVANFWARGGAVYLAYKGAQVRAAALRKTRGWDAERLRTDFWAPHHAWAGQQFHSMAIDLRGFYLKIGQFFAARAEFVPEPICRKLSLLHDQVPPMPRAKTVAVIEGELGGCPIGDVFEWIDLDSVLGSASIAQVHKAQLKGYRERGRLQRLAGAVVSPEPQQQPQGPTHDLRRLLGRRRGRPAPAQRAPEPANAAEAARQAVAGPDCPEGGIVAVKVQYPDALPVMMGDLKQIRRFARIIQRLEIDFDLLSAVDELADQVRLEFDFRREAAVMDAVADDLKALAGRVAVPHSVPGLASRRLLAMQYLPGVKITDLKDSVAGLAPAVQRRAKARILGSVAQAYGRMILGSGLFQADPHPGNILIMPGGRVGLIDYGQSKQLPPAARLGFAALVCEMARGKRAADPLVLSQRLRDMGLRFSSDDSPRIQAMMAFGMFDTELSHRVDPFSPDSPIKKLGITHFPPEAFFVLRTVQMLRGLAMGLSQPDFSTAREWAPLARAALRSA